MLHLILSTLGVTGIPGNGLINFLILVDSPAKHEIVLETLMDDLGMEIGTLAVSK